MTVKNKCLVKSCNRLAKTVGPGYCIAHEARRVKWGDVKEDIPIREFHTGCSVPGCDREHEARGLCAKHHLHLLRYGKPEKEPKKYNGELCKEPGCTKLARNNWYCATHNAKYHTRKLVKERKQAGLCPGCGKVLDRKGRLCVFCLKRFTRLRIQLREKRTTEGRCIWCNSNKDAFISTGYNGKYCVCKICFLKLAAERSLGKKSQWQELLNVLEKQKYCCAYTGRKLTLGVNAEVDHKIPRCLDGKKELSNVHWIHKEINQIKVEVPESEFLKLCKLVAERN